MAGGTWASATRPSIFFHTNGLEYFLSLLPGDDLVDGVAVTNSAGMLVLQYV